MEPGWLRWGRRMSAGGCADLALRRAVPAAQQHSRGEREPGRAEQPEGDAQRCGRSRSPVTGSGRPSRQPRPPPVGTCGGAVGAARPAGRQMLRLGQRRGLPPADGRAFGSPGGKRLGQDHAEAGRPGEPLAERVAREGSDRAHLQGGARGRCCWRQAHGGRREGGVCAGDWTRTKQTVGGRGRGTRKTPARTRGGCGWGQFASVPVDVVGCARACGVPLGPSVAGGLVYLGRDRSWAFKIPNRKGAAAGLCATAAGRRTSQHHCA